MDLFEDDPAPGPGNAPEYTVSEISGAVKRTVEGAFDNVRVRGEVGRVSRPGSGHVYLDLKDAGATLACVVWRAQVARLEVRPEEGMEVVATGRLTTFPGQSKYQMVIEALAPAGVGALMAMLEKRRQALAAEGLFDAGRKRPLPYLPEVIGVVTSPTGAVIRDILHRLHERFPRHVLVWPVPVQGPNCAPEVARAIAGFDALPRGGPIPRPDVLIVARGGGSVEDLWGFNEEAVVRAAAACTIPLISAVGHETDTTLIDHVADRRAPTPTAAAEMAVPVRRELMIWAGGQGVRLARALNQGVTARGVRLRDLSRALPRAEALVAGPRQRLDWLGERLDAATRRAAERRQAALREAAAILRPATLRDRVARDRQRVAVAARLDTALRRQDERRRGALREAAAALRPQTLGARVARDGQRCAALGRRLAPEVMAQGIGRRAAALAALVRTLRRDAALRYVSGRRERLDRAGARFTGALVEAAIAGHRAWLDERAEWMEAAARQRLAVLAERLAAVDRVRETAGYAATLARGYAVVWSGERVVTGVAAAREAPGLSVQFADGRVDVGPARRRPRDRTEEPEQGELF